MLKHHAMHYIIAFKASISIMGWAFTKPTILRPRFVPRHT